MKNFNYMVAGFCAASGLVNIMAEQYVIGVAVLFLAFINYKMAGLNEE